MSYLASKANELDDLDDNPSVSKKDIENEAKEVKAHLLFRPADRPVRFTVTTNRLVIKLEPSVCNCRSIDCYAYGALQRPILRISQLN